MKFELCFFAFIGSFVAKAVPLQRDLKSNLVAGNFIYECPDGFSLENSLCTQHKLQDIVHVCPPGSRLLNGACTLISPVTQTCPDGFVLRNNKCIHIVENSTTKVCREGMSLKGDICERVVAHTTRCSKGHRRTDEGCYEYAPKQYKCPNGFRKSGQRCIKIHKHDKIVKCPLDHFAYRGECVDLKIGTTSDASYNHVYRSERCAPGFTDKSSRCTWREHAPPIYIMSPVPSRATLTCQKGNGEECTEVTVETLTSECPEGFEEENNETNTYCKRQTQPAEVRATLIAQTEPSHSCSAGFTKSGNKCLKMTEHSPATACGEGMEPFAGRCVKFLQHEEKCSDGGTMRSGRCILTTTLKPTIIITNRK